MRRADFNRLRLRVAGAMLVLAAPAILCCAGAAHGQSGAPGPELFAKPPQTPMELWDAVDYLVKVGKADLAVPYLKAFLDGSPDDATLLQVKDRYGAGSVLQLEDYPETQPYAQTLLEALNAAARRRASDPERLTRFVNALTATQAEQAYGLEQLRNAGPYAVPPILEALGRPNLTPEQRTRIANNLGRLDATAVPALIAALDAPETLAADAAEALGRIGDPRALPFLAHPAADDERLIVRDPARRAIERLTRRSYAGQTLSPTRVLVDEAKKYLNHQITFPGTGDRTELWTYDDATGLTPRDVSRSEAEGFLGLKLARQALDLDPNDRDAQAVTTALALQKAAERSGVAGFMADPSGAYTTALTAGPDVLGEVLRLALDGNLPELSAVAAATLGQVAGREDLIAPRAGHHPLVAALTSPDPRTQFAAAQALVQLDPRGTFPGASRVVPVLARFVTMRDAPRAVVIDGDLNRAGQVAAVLRELGYDPVTADRGPEGFRQAAASADVELIMMHPGLLEGAWNSLDALTNLRADPATAGIPVILYGPLGMGYSPMEFTPSVVVVDSDPVRGNQLATVLRGLGYAPTVATSGPEGRRAAAERNAAAVFLETSAAGDAATSAEFVRRLREEAATASTPVLFIGPPGTREAYSELLKTRETAYIVGPFDPIMTRAAVVTELLREMIRLGAPPLRIQRVPSEVRSRVLAQIDPDRDPRTVFTVEPTDAAAFRPILQRELERMGARPLSPQERQGYAQAAAGLLATVALRPGSPFENDVAGVEPALAEALTNPVTAPASLLALGDVPDVNAQRQLADQVLDSAQPADRRIAAASALTRSIQRFGPLLADAQERAILQARDAAAEPVLRSALSAILGALRPSADVVTPRLRAFEPGRVLPTPAPEAAPVPTSTQ